MSIINTLAFKLTVAFLVVGTVGVSLVSLLAREQTQNEFDQFVADRFQADLVEQLEIYYLVNGSWQGIEKQLTYNRRGRPPRANGGIVIADDQGKIVFQPAQRNEQNAFLSENQQARSLTLQDNDGQTIGYLVNSGPDHPISPPIDNLESEFIRQVNRAIYWSALAAGAFALAVGIILARTLSHPIRELTVATQAIAAGDLKQQVEVRSQDELGQLANSFNQMSHDLSEAVRLRRQMTADIAHDLRTPLTVILGYTEALSDAKLSGSPEIYQVLYDEALHLQRLIDDLRLLALADAGELTLNPTPTAPREIIDRAFRSYRPQAETAGITLQTDIADNLPSVIIDPDRFAQILGNLISNSLRYTPPGGQITLAAQPLNTMAGVQLRVSDTGQGIPSVDLPHIFDRFYRSDKARTQEDGESGLGLAIVKSLVEAHHGSIHIESTVNHGTTISIHINNIA